MIRSNIFPKIGRSETGWWFLTFSLSSCLWIGPTLPILHSVGKISDSIQEGKIKCNGLQIALSQIYTMRMLIWSCPWALLGSNFLITLRISSSVKFIVFKDSFVLRNIWVGKLLPVSIRVHCFTKNELNNSLFSLKSTTNRLLWIKGGMQGVLLLRKFFDMDQ